ncbi:MAG TPA: hypothetical protein VG994_12245 [Steroidobacteraceae bacterium]|nr:hypothetical protein [Steroidobacteraceae bacterium]
MRILCATDLIEPFAAARIEARYETPEVHRAAFALPWFMQDAVDSAAHREPLPRVSGSGAMNGGVGNMRREDERGAVHPRTDEARQSNVVALRRECLREELAAPERVAHQQSSRFPEYPLERRCTHRHEPFQLSFARQAQELLRERDDVELRASHRGLTIRGETEEAIAAALEALQDYYGSQLDIGPPTIRYHNGVTLEQPWMGLTVRCPVEYLEPVQVDLIVRNATIGVCETYAGRCLLQACAPLACLIGYRAALEKLTSGAGRHAMWLSHYAPIEFLPPSGDAA